MSTALQQLFFTPSFTAQLKREGVDLPGAEEAHISQLLSETTDKAKQVLQGLSGSTLEQVKIAASDAFTSAFATTMRIWAGVAAAAVVIAIVAIRRVRPGPEEEMQTIELSLPHEVEEEWHGSHDGGDTPPSGA